MRQTSIDAYNKIKNDGLLSRARFQVYDILFNYGPLTAGEVFEIGQRQSFGHLLVKGSICARITELFESGVVAEVGVKNCRFTGHSATLWDVTDKTPIPLKRPVSRLKEAENLLKEIYENPQDLENWRIKYENWRK